MATGKSTQLTREGSRPSVRMVEVGAEQAGQRIDNFLLKILKGVPKSYVYRVLRKGEVRVNKGRVNATYRIQTGDMVRVPPVRLPQNAGEERPRPSDGALAAIADSILYEDKAIIVINKPSGMAVHGGSGIQYGVIEALRTLYPNMKNLELVHRLDRETSGCLLISKKNSALRHLHEQIRAKSVQKEYMALVKGRFTDQSRRVNVPLKKNVLRSGERVVRVDPEGKPSVSVFSSLQVYADATLVKVQAVTGRTHQIRVHGAHIGHPLAGDEKYGDEVFNQTMREAGLKRLFLHASHLHFTLPGSDEALSVSAPLPPVLNDVLNRLPARG